MERSNKSTVKFFRDARSFPEQRSEEEVKNNVMPRESDMPLPSQWDSFATCILTPGNKVDAFTQDEVLHLSRLVRLARFSGGVLGTSAIHAFGQLSTSEQNVGLDWSSLFVALLVAPLPHGCCPGAEQKWSRDVLTSFLAWWSKGSSAEYATNMVKELFGMVQSDVTQRPALAGMSFVLRSCFKPDDAKSAEWLRDTVCWMWQQVSKDVSSNNGYFWSILARSTRVAFQLEFEKNDFLATLEMVVEDVCAFQEASGGIAQQLAVVLSCAMTNTTALPIWFLSCEESITVPDNCTQVFMNHVLDESDAYVSNLGPIYKGQMLKMCDIIFSHALKYTDTVCLAVVWSLAWHLEVRSGGSLSLSPADSALSKLVKSFGNRNSSWKACGEGAIECLHRLSGRRVPSFEQFYASNLDSDLWNKFHDTVMTQDASVDSALVHLPSLYSAVLALNPKAAFSELDIVTDVQISSDNLKEPIRTGGFPIRDVKQPNLRSSSSIDTVRFALLALFQAYQILVLAKPPSFDKESKKEVVPSQSVDSVENQCKWGLVKACQMTIKSKGSMWRFAEMIAVQAFATATAAIEQVKQDELSNPDQDESTAGSAWKVLMPWLVATLRISVEEKVGPKVSHAAQRFIGNQKVWILPTRLVLGHGDYGDGEEVNQVKVDNESGYSALVGECRENSSLITPHQALHILKIQSVLRNLQQTVHTVDKDGRNRALVQFCKLARQWLPSVGLDRCHQFMSSFPTVLASTVNLASVSSNVMIGVDSLILPKCTFAKSGLLDNFKFKKGADEIADAVEVEFFAYWMTWCIENDHADHFKIQHAEMIVNSSWHSSKIDEEGIVDDAAWLDAHSAIQAATKKLIDTASNISFGDTFRFSKMVCEQSLREIESRCTSNRLVVSRLGVACRLTTQLLDIHTELNPTFHGLLAVLLKLAVRPIINVESSPSFPSVAADKEDEERLAGIAKQVLKAFAQPKSSSKWDGPGDFLVPWHPQRKQENAMRRRWLETEDRARRFMPVDSSLQVVDAQLTPSLADVLKCELNDLGDINHLLFSINNGCALGCLPDRIKDTPELFAYDSDLDSKVHCTYRDTGPEFTLQPWYHCLTCGMTEDKGCCTACAMTCHRGHHVVFVKFSKFFCDCGAGGHCQCVNQDRLGSRMGSYSNWANKAFCSVATKGSSGSVRDQNCVMPPALHNISSSRNAFPPAPALPSDGQSFFQPSPTQPPPPPPLPVERQRSGSVPRPRSPRESSLNPERKRRRRSTSVPPPIERARHGNIEDWIMKDQSGGVPKDLEIALEGMPKPGQALDSLWRTNNGMGWCQFPFIGVDPVHNENNIASAIQDYFNDTTNDQSTSSQPPPPPVLPPTLEASLRLHRIAHIRAPPSVGAARNRTSVAHLPKGLVALMSPKTVAFIVRGKLSMAEFTSHAEPYKPSDGQPKQDLPSFYGIFTTPNLCQLDPNSWHRGLLLTSTRQRVELFSARTTPAAPPKANDNSFARLHRAGGPKRSRRVVLPFKSASSASSSSSQPDSNASDDNILKTMWLPFWPSCVAVARGSEIQIYEISHGDEQCLICTLKMPSGVKVIDIAFKATDRKASNLYSYHIFILTDQKTIFSREVDLPCDEESINLSKPDEGIFTIALAKTVKAVCMAYDHLSGYLAVAYDDGSCSSGIPQNSNLLNLIEIHPSLPAPSTKNEADEGNGKGRAKGKAQAKRKITLSDLANYSASQSSGSTQRMARVQRPMASRAEIGVFGASSEKGTVNSLRPVATRASNPFSTSSDVPRGFSSLQAWPGHPGFIAVSKCQDCVWLFSITVAVRANLNSDSLHFGNNLDTIPRHALKIKPASGRVESAHAATFGVDGLLLIAILTDDGAVHVHHAVPTQRGYEMPYGIFSINARHSGQSCDGTSTNTPDPIDFFENAMSCVDDQEKRLCLQAPTGLLSPLDEMNRGQFGADPSRGQFIPVLDIGISGSLAKEFVPVGARVFLSVTSTDPGVLNATWHTARIKGRIVRFRMGTSARWVEFPLWPSESWVVDFQGRLRIEFTYGPGSPIFMEACDLYVVPREEFFRLSKPLAGPASSYNLSIMNESPWGVGLAPSCWPLVWPARSDVYQMLLSRFQTYSITDSKFDEILAINTATLLADACRKEPSNFKSICLDHGERLLTFGRSAALDNAARDLLVAATSGYDSTDHGTGQRLRIGRELILASRSWITASIVEGGQRQSEKPLELVIFVLSLWCNAARVQPDVLPHALKTLNQESDGKCLFVKCVQDAVNEHLSFGSSKLLQILSATVIRTLIEGSLLLTMLQLHLDGPSEPVTRYGDLGAWPRSDELLRNAFSFILQRNGTLMPVVMTSLHFSLNFCFPSVGSDIHVADLQFLLVQWLVVRYEPSEDIVYSRCTAFSLVQMLLRTQLACSSSWGSGSNGLEAVLWRQVLAHLLKGVSSFSGQVDDAIALQIALAADVCNILSSRDASRAFAAAGQQLLSLWCLLQKREENVLKVLDSCVEEIDDKEAYTDMSMNQTDFWTEAGVEHMPSTFPLDITSLTQTHRELSADCLAFLPSSWRQYCDEIGEHPLNDQRRLLCTSLLKLLRVGGVMSKRSTFLLNKRYRTNRGNRSPGSRSQLNPTSLLVCLRQSLRSSSGECASSTLVEMGRQPPVPCDGLGIGAIASDLTPPPDDDVDMHDANHGLNHIVIPDSDVSDHERKEWDSVTEPIVNSGSVSEIDSDSDCELDMLDDHADEPFRKMVIRIFSDICCGESDRWKPIRNEGKLLVWEHVGHSRRKLDLFLTRMQLKKKLSALTYYAPDLPSASDRLPQITPCGNVLAVVQNRQNVFSSGSSVCETEVKNVMTESKKHAVVNKVCKELWEFAASLRPQTWCWHFNNSDVLEHGYELKRLLAAALHYLPVPSGSRSTMVNPKSAPVPECLRILAVSLACAFNPKLKGRCWPNRDDLVVAFTHGRELWLASPQESTRRMGAMVLCLLWDAIRLQTDNSGVVDSPCSTDLLPLKGLSQKLRKLGARCSETCFVYAHASNDCHGSFANNVLTTATDLMISWARTPEKVNTDPSGLDPQQRMECLLFEDALDSHGTLSEQFYTLKRSACSVVSRGGRNDHGMREFLSEFETDFVCPMSKVNENTSDNVGKWWPRCFKNDWQEPEEEGRQEDASAAFKQRSTLACQAVEGSNVFCTLCSWKPPQFTSCTREQLGSVKYHDSGYVVKLHRVMQVQSVTLNVHSITSPASRPVAMVEVRGLSIALPDLPAVTSVSISEWQPLCRMYVPIDDPGRVDLVATLPGGPFTATALRVDFLEVGQLSVNHPVSSIAPDATGLLCPRCHTMVNSRGICKKCTNNVFACTSCHYINHEKLDALFCSDCGHSREMRFDLTVSCRHWPSGAPFSGACSDGGASSSNCDPFLRSLIDGGGDEGRSTEAIGPTQLLHNTVKTMAKHSSAAIRAAGCPGNLLLSAGRDSRRGSALLRRARSTSPVRASSPTGKRPALSIAAGIGITSSVVGMNELRCQLSQSSSSFAPPLRRSRSCDSQIPAEVHVACAICDVAVVTSCGRAAIDLLQKGVTLDTQYSKRLVDVLFHGLLQMDDVSLPRLAVTLLVELCHSNTVLEKHVLSLAISRVDSELKFAVSRASSGYGCASIPLQLTGVLALLSQLCRSFLSDASLDLRLRARIQCIITALRPDRACPAAVEHVIIPVLQSLEADIENSDAIATRLEKVLAIPNGCWSGRDTVENLRFVAISLNKWKPDRSARALTGSWLWQCLARVGYRHVRAVTLALLRKLLIFSKQPRRLNIQLLRWIEICFDFEMGPPDASPLRTPSALPVIHEGSNRGAARTISDEAMAVFFEIFNSGFGMQVLALKRGWVGRLTGILSRQAGMLQQDLRQQMERQLQGGEVLDWGCIQPCQAYGISNGASCLAVWLEHPILRPVVLRDQRLADVALRVTLTLRGVAASPILMSNHVLEAVSSLETLFGDLRSSNRGVDRYLRACVKSLETHTSTAEGAMDRTALRMMASREHGYVLQQLQTILTAPLQRKQAPVKINLVKSPTQEEFIQGCMTGNPYGLSAFNGTTIRDVRKRIVQDLNMPDAEDIIEIIAEDKVLATNLDIRGVFEHFTQGEGNINNKSSSEPLILTYRLQGLDANADEDVLEALPPRDDAAQEKERKKGLAQQFKQHGGIDMLLSGLVHEQDMDPKGILYAGLTRARIAVMQCAIEADEPKSNGRLETGSIRAQLSRPLAWRALLACLRHWLRVLWAPETNTDDDVDMASSCINIQEDKDMSVVAETVHAVLSLVKVVLGQPGDFLSMSLDDMIPEQEESCGTKQTRLEDEADIMKELLRLVCSAPSVSQAHSTATNSGSNTDSDSLPQLICGILPRLALRGDEHCCQSLMHELKASLESTSGQNHLAHYLVETVISACGGYTRLIRSAATEGVTEAAVTRCLSLLVIGDKKENDKINFVVSSIALRTLMPLVANCHIGQKHLSQDFFKRLHMVEKRYRTSARADEGELAQLAKTLLDEFGKPSPQKQQRNGSSSFIFESASIIGLFFASKARRFTSSLSSIAFRFLAARALASAFLLATSDRNV